MHCLPVVDPEDVNNEGTVHSVHWTKFLSEGYQSIVLNGRHRGRSVQAKTDGYGMDCAAYLVCRYHTSPANSTATQPVYARKLTHSGSLYTGTARRKATFTGITQSVLS